MKRFALLAAALAAAVALTSCSATPEKTTVATVGEDKITLADFNNEYEYYLSQYGIEDDEAEDIAADTKQLRQDIIDALVTRKIELAWAKEQGVYELTAEEEEEVQTEFDDMMAQWLDYFKQQAQTEDATLTGDALEKAAKEKFDEYMESINYTNDQMLAVQRETFITDKLFSLVTADVAVSDDAVEVKYNDYIVDAKDTYASDPTQFQQDMSDSTATVYYIPEGVRKVKHILVELTSEQQEEIYALRYTDGDEEGANAKREEYLATIKEEAEDILAQIEPDASNFDELMEEYNGERAGSEFYLLSGGESLIPEFTEAGLALEEPGDFTGLVGGDYGYHIILYVEDLPEGAALTLDEAKEDIHTELLTTAQQEKYDELLEEFRTGVEVEINTKELRLD